MIGKDRLEWLSARLQLEMTNASCQELGLDLLEELLAHVAETERELERLRRVEAAASELMKCVRRERFEYEGYSVEAICVYEDDVAALSHALKE